MSFLRANSITCLFYIDDRLIEEYNGQAPSHLDSSRNRAELAIRYAVQLFVSLGYFINISKSVFIPTQCIIFLGMIIDSIQGSFFVTAKRKDKFKKIRDNLLQCKKVSLTTLQKFIGMCISMWLAIPAAKLYKNHRNIN